MRTDTTCLYFAKWIVKPNKFLHLPIDGSLNWMRTLSWVAKMPRGCGGDDVLLWLWSCHLHRIGQSGRRWAEENRGTRRRRPEPVRLALLAFSSEDSDTRRTFLFLSTLFLLCAPPTFFPVVGTHLFSFLAFIIISRRICSLRWLRTDGAMLYHVQLQLHIFVVDIQRLQVMKQRT